MQTRFDLLALATGLLVLGTAVGLAPRAPRAAALRVIDAGAIEITTDASDGEVARARQVLEDLRAQFEQTFAPLIAQPSATGQLRFVFLNSESDFRAYTRRVAPALAGSAGFYAATENLLVVHNQTGSAPFARARDRVLSRQRRVTERVQAAAQLDGLLEEARAATDRLLRHEGAHQLFHAYRIESPHRLELTWLSEGLAQYCEPPQLGALHEPLAQRLVRARETGQLLPLETLLNHRDAAGFFSLPAEQMEIAYAQSWALVYLLMQPHNRPDFFAFIERYRQGDLTGPRIESLHAEWQSFIATVR